jgi:hypothetical protein
MIFLNNCQTFDNKLTAQDYSSFGKHSFGSKLEDIINVEGEADYIEEYPNRFYYYNREVAGYNVDISYTFLDKELLVTHYFIILNEKNETICRNIFNEISQYYNSNYEDSNIKTVDYITFILYESLWRVNNDPMEFIKITMSIPKENELNPNIEIIITHSPLAI